MKFINRHFAKYTGTQKAFFVFSLGILLGWAHDYFFSPVCHLLVLSGKNLVYAPDYLEILVIAIFLVLGALSIGAVLWVWEKIVNSKKHVSNSPINDAERTGTQARGIHFIDKFVWSGIFVFLVCTISLACERFF